MSRIISIIIAFVVCLSAIPALAGTITVTAVGDILPQASWRKTAPSISRLFAGVQKRLRKADIVIGNLETPLTCSVEPTPNKDPELIKAKRDFVFRCDRPKAACAMKDAGFTVLTLANNHMMDYGDDGLADTLDRLDEVGIPHAGAGGDETDARMPAVLDVKGRRVIVFSASDIVPQGYGADEDGPGIASMKDESGLLEAVAVARDEYPDALILLSLHWGVEATFEPTERQRRVAHMLIDCGADAIFGHHPHRIQPVEMYRGRPVFYSLGNFQFATKDDGADSVIVTVAFPDGPDPKIRYTIRPVAISRNGVPRILGKKEPGYWKIMGEIGR